MYVRSQCSLVQPYDQIREPKHCLWIVKHFLGCLATGKSKLFVLTEREGGGKSESQCT